MKPSASEAMAERFTVDPTAAKEPVAGAVSETVGAVPVAVTKFKVPVAESTVVPSAKVA